jgi:hypothetical protein
MINAHSIADNTVLSYRDPATGRSLYIKKDRIPPLRSVTHRMGPVTKNVENLNDLLEVESFESFTIAEYLDGRVLNGPLISSEGDAYRFDDGVFGETIEILVQQFEPAVFPGDRTKRRPRAL